MATHRRRPAPQRDQRVNVNLLINQAQLAKRVRDEFWSPRFSAEVDRRLTDSTYTRHNVAALCEIPLTKLDECIACKTAWHFDDFIAVARLLHIDPRLSIVPDMREMDAELVRRIKEELGLPDNDLIG